MKIKNYWSTGCCVLLCISTRLLAQTTYLSYNSTMKSLRAAGDSVMAARTSVSPTTVAEQLELPASRPLILPAGKKSGKLLDNEIYKKIKPAVLIIGMVYRGATDTMSRVNIASGYVIGASGICVSNYHVMFAYSHSPTGGKYSLVAQNGEGKVFAIAKVLYSSVDDDLAVFQLDLGGIKTLRYLNLADNDPGVGDPVYVLGQPQGMFYFFSKGMVADAYSDHVPLINNKGYTNRNTVAITADYGTGSSGGPILNDKGDVIATVSSTRTISQDGIGRSIPQMVVKNTIPVSSLKRLFFKLKPSLSPITDNSAIK